MTAYSRRGFRIRLILEDYDDHRKKCFFFVNILREKYVRNVIQRIWHFFYKECVSSPDELFLEIDDFFIPPGESTLVLKENDMVSVRVRHQAVSGAPSLATAGAVRSTVAPLTAAPETLVESVALVLRRLQDGEGPDDSERSERNRLSKVAEILAAVSGSSDVSTDEEGVQDLANQLTSRQEVVRLSQKMADQATPPPPCAAKKHNLDSKHLSLVEISRELRRRYEAARQPQPSVTRSSTAPVAIKSPTTPTVAPPHLPGVPVTVRPSTITASGALTIATAVASPNMSMTSLDSPASLLEIAKMLEASAETPGTSNETSGTSAGACTSTPFTTLSLGTRHGPVGGSSVKRPEHGCASGGGREIKDARHGVESSTAMRCYEGASLPGDKVGNDVKVVPCGDELGEISLGSSGKRLQKAAEEKAPVIVQDMLAIAESSPIVDQDATSGKGGKKSSGLERGQDMSVAKHRDAPVIGLKRGRSPSGDSPSASDSSSEEDHPAKSNPTKKSATTSNTCAVGDGASTEKKKKTRTRRRRGKKRRTPETSLAPPPPPLPQPRVADYAQRHGLPRGEIDRYKRAASVGIGWQTRPKNRRVVFDDDGIPVSPGGADSMSSAAVAAPGRAWRGAMREGGGQWAWSQGRRQDQGAEYERFGRGRSSDGAHYAGCQSGDILVKEDHSKTTLMKVEDHENRSDATPNSHTRISVGPRTGTGSPCTKDSRLMALDTTSNEPNCNPIATSSSTLSSLPSTGTTSTRSLCSPWDKKPLRIGGPALGMGESKRCGSLGSGLLPRAFMRPRRCVDPPRRSEVLCGPVTEEATLSRTVANASSVKAGVAATSPKGTTEKLLEPSYLLASRGGTSAGASSSSCAVQNTKRTAEDAGKDSNIADIRGQDSVSTTASQPPVLSRPQKSGSGQESCLVDAPSTFTPSATKIISQSSASVPGATTASSSTSASTISKGTASPIVPSTPAPDVRTPVPASHSTVVLDGSGRPPETDASRDLRLLAASGERCPLVVVRRDRPLPGRASYRETTKQEGPCTLRQVTGKQHDVDAATTDTSNETSTGPDAGTRGVSAAQGEGRHDGDGDEDVCLEGRRRHLGNLDTKAGNTDDEDEKGMEIVSSSDVYSNISVILAGPPLETLPPEVEDSRESTENSDDSEDSSDVPDDGQDSRDEVECLEGPSLASTGRADASVDSIANCNVVNVVGQNRRLEKQRARARSASGDKENQAPENTVKDERFYFQFPIMKEARKGDLIAFKCWDMAADYSPFVSDYKEATVLDIVGEKPEVVRLTLQLLEYRPRGRRRGRFEISAPDDDEVVDLEEESGIEERRWAELIQPRLLFP